jgi:dihydrofolate reductase
MRKIILLMHVSLDGFVAGPSGEMDWIKLDDEMFDMVGDLTNDADAALYGRITYEMMDSYWPHAGSLPGATKHDVDHSLWYNKVEKLVLSKTLEGKEKDRTSFIGTGSMEKLKEIRRKAGKNILMIGSPGAAHSLMRDDLIDEYWLFINPILLGKGIPLFAPIPEPTRLKLLNNKVFGCGVTGLNYRVEH